MAEEEGAVRTGGLLSGGCRFVDDDMSTAQEANAGQREYDAIEKKERKARCGVARNVGR